MNRKIYRWLSILSLLVAVAVVPASAATIAYTYDAAGRLTKANYGTKAITYAYDNNGNLLQMSVGQTGPTSLPLMAGWNLVSSTTSIPSAIFDDGSKFASAWKWEKGTWAVYVPGEETPGAYAKSKGFGQMNAISPGEGFWVNTKEATSIGLTGTPEYGGLSFASGWNLVGLKSDAAVSVSSLTIDHPGIISLWKWENKTWSVSLPAEITPGAYATSKEFGQLTTVNPGEGFWVNVAQ